MARITTFVLAALLGFAQAAMADKVSIINEPNGVERPKNGMSMEQVKARFGVAKSELGAVGEPPITRWVYNDFTVYYEHHLVIHSVAHTHDGYIGAPGAADVTPSSDSSATNSNGSTDDDSPLFLH